MVPRYERIAFEKDLLTLPDKPPAAFICPGHPCSMPRSISSWSDIGIFCGAAVLVDETDPGEDPE